MVLNTIDEIINGQPKYNITDNIDGTKNIELANEIIEQGTPLNKSFFNKLENVLSYNEITGQYNSQTQNVEMNIDTPTSNLVDNQIILGQMKSQITTPDLFSIVKQQISFPHTYFFENVKSCIQLNNGNILTFGGISGNLIYTIFNQNGDCLSYDYNGVLSGDYNLIPFKLNDGRIVVFGSTGSAINYCIFNADGTYSSSNTLFNQSNSYVNAIRLNNGGFLVFARYSNVNLYYEILGADLSVVKSKTQLSGKYNDAICKQFDNGNIIFVGSNTDEYSTGYYSIISDTGVEVKSSTSLGGGASGGYNLTNIDNDKMLLCYGGGSSYSQYRGIILYEINNSGTIVKTSERFSQFSSHTKLEVYYENNRYFVFTWNTASLCLIFNKDLVLISYSPSSLFSASELVPLKIGNYLLVFYWVSSVKTKCSIIDFNGNLISTYDISNDTYSMRNNFPIVLTNGNIFMTSFYNSSNRNYPNYSIFSFIDYGILLNNINIDTLLEVDKYYEIIYNQSQNKLIAQEVRN